MVNNSKVFKTSNVDQCINKQNKIERIHTAIKTDSYLQALIDQLVRVISRDTGDVESIKLQTQLIKKLEALIEERQRQIIKSFKPI